MKAFQFDIDQLRDLIEVQQLTQAQVAAILGCNRTTLQRACYRYDLNTQRTGPRSGDKHPEWKGGRTLVGGYWYIYQPDHPHRTKKNTVAEHRLVMEAHLGRYLLRTEVVHHKNGDSQDNRLENLEVFSTNALHLKHELTGRIPNWSAQGVEAMAAGSRKRRIQLQTAKRDAQGRLLSNDHFSSTNEHKVLEVS